jgi:hypothetical protein
LLTFCATGFLLKDGLGSVSNEKLDQRSIFRPIAAALTKNLPYSIAGAWSVSIDPNGHGHTHDAAGFPQLQMLQRRLRWSGKISFRSKQIIAATIGVLFPWLV